jgi:hypothetical protein
MRRRLFLRFRSRPVWNVFNLAGRLDGGGAAAGDERVMAVAVIALGTDGFSIRLRNGFQRLNATTFVFVLSSVLSFLVSVS